MYHCLCVYILPHYCDFMMSKLSLAMADFYIHLVFFIFLFPLYALAQTNGNVSIGSTLTANEISRPWLSPASDFAFGFQKIQDKDLFLLSIWYYKIPDRTIVWYVNSINPVPQGSTVKLDAEKGIVLSDPQGIELWSSGGLSDPVDHGFLNDTGNFVLMGSDNSSLWESFELPSDTMLPMQELRLGDFLRSRKSESNFSQGRFYLQFRHDGNLVLASRSVASNVDDDVVYYNSQTSDPTNASNSGYRVGYDYRGSMYITKINNQTQEVGPVSTSLASSENYYRIKLEFDGVLVHYRYPRNFQGNNQNWNVVWSIPDDICAPNGDKGSGACGFNSICTLENKRPACECQKGFTLLDPDDTYGSCAMNYTPSCFSPVKRRSADEILELDNVDWPLNDYEQISPSNESVCRQACLEDCFCGAAIFRSNSCWKKRLPLSNGKVDLTLNSKAFIKYNKDFSYVSPVPAPPVPEQLKTKDRENLILIIVGSILLGGSILINVFFVGMTCLHSYLRRKKMEFNPNHNIPEVSLRYFTYKELAGATNGFKEELGSGSCGTVYKGVLQMSSRKSTVAVKKLVRLAKDAEKEFRAEVNTIGQTNHKNLVRLLGFCDEGQHRLLVYEYMSSGTLASFLFCDHKPKWNMRTQIAIGIARGLVYLHEECSTQIIHCDIKPQNILLDDYYNARISDFGLAKLLMINQSKTHTELRGTKGYVAPEWFRSNQVTAKVDVYSFGVLLLEIISCRRCLEDIENCGDNAVPLTEFAWDCFQAGRLDCLVRNDPEALNDGMILERFVMVGMWCIQDNSSHRPTMRKVSQMLEGIVEVTVPPCPYPFSTTL